MLNQINSHLKHPSDLQEMETQASPSLISIKQSDLKIVIDDFPEDQSEGSPSSKLKDPVYSIAKMIEEIKQMSKKKRVNGNLYEYYTCHSCRALLEKRLLIYCSETSCQRYFCLRCVNKRYNLTPEEIYEIKKFDIWACFSCRGMCSCKICKQRFFDKVDVFSDSLFLSTNEKKETSISAKVEQSENEQSLHPLQENEKGDKTVRLEKQKRGRKTGKNAQENQNVQLQRKNRKSVETLNQPEEPTDNNLDQPIRVNIRNTRERNTRPRKIKQKEDFNDKGRKSMGECHLCGGNLPDSSLATCSIKACKTQFCISCVQDFHLENYNPRCWVCYSCGGSCKCLQCLKRRSKEAKERVRVNYAELDIKEDKPRKKNRSPKNRRSNLRKKGQDSSAEPVKRKYLVVDDKNICPKIEETPIIYEPDKYHTQTVWEYDFIVKKEPKEVIMLDKKHIDDSKIISEINIDSACITLYDAENEDQLKHEIQRKLDN